jgi:hypothetical protein
MNTIDKPEIKTNWTLTDHLLVYRVNDKPVNEYILDKKFKSVAGIEGSDDYVILIDEGYSFFQEDFEDHFVNLSVFSLSKGLIVAEEFLSGGFLGLITDNKGISVVLNKGLGYVGTKGLVLKLNLGLELLQTLDFEFDFELQGSEVKGKKFLGIGHHGVLSVLDPETGKITKLTTKEKV